MAVSGGMDSVALLHLTAEMRSAANFQVFAVHVNHGLRNASEEEEMFVQDLCDGFNVSLTVHHANSEFLKGESMEMWARRVRQDAFESTRKKLNCDYILTAHHANDNLETILMHLDDGCGIEGLRGIPKKNGMTIRPLLKFGRNDIQEYVHRHCLKYMEDESNFDVSIKRNFVRHQVVQPWTEQVNDLVDQFGVLSQKVSIAVERMNDVIDQLANQVEIREDNKIIYDRLVEPLTTIQFVRLIKHVMGETQISWRRHRWEELSRWLKAPKIGSKLNLSDQWTILRDRDSWILADATTQPINLSVENTGQFGSDGFSISLNKIEAPTVNSNPFHEVIDQNAVKDKTLIIRSWCDGDTFQPLGMAGHKKVSDFLVDEKVDSFAKDKQLVLTANEEIIWLCGRRLSDTVKVTDSTTEYLELYLETAVG